MSDENNNDAANKIEVITKKFYKLLKESKVDKNESNFNFISIKKYPIKYNISNIGKFWKYYNFLIENTTKIFYLMERPMLNYSYLRFDIDFYGLKKNEERLYDNNILTNIITYITNLINKVICNDIKYDKKQTTCCLFLKKTWTEKDGIHLLFPYFICNKEYHDYFVNELRKYLNQLIPENKNISKINVDNVFNLSWVLYRSKKNNDSILYELYAVYLNKEVINNINKFKVPSLYSVNKQSNDVYVKSKVKINNVKSFLTNKQIKNNLHTIINNNLLDLLDRDRANEYNLWISLGIILFNLGCGSNDFLELWIDFSKKSPKYDKKNIENDCVNKWKTFKVTNITINTLLYLIKKDNPDSYNNLKNIKINELINSNYDQSNDILKCDEIIYQENIAEIFKDIYQLDIVYVSINNKQGEWYIFNGVTYDKQPIQVIRTNLKKLYDTLYDIFSNLIINTDNEDKKNKLSKNIKTIKKWLKTDSTINAIINLAKDNLINVNFVKLKDTNPYLIACNNGIIDLENKIFRESTPDDFCTLRTNILFETVLLKIEQDALEDYLSKLFTDADLRNEFLRLLASLLIPTTKEKKMIFAVGETNSGKSKFVNFLEYAFGEYVGPLPKEFMYKNKNKSSSQAKPELSKTKGTIFAFISELSNMDKLDIAHLKEITGGDTTFTRGLYEGGTNMKISFALYVSTNIDNIPHIPEDDAFWGRLYIVEFSSLYSDTYPQDEKEQYEKKIFPNNTELDMFFRSHAHVLLHKIFEIYKTIEKKEKFPIIQAYTKKIRKSNSIICEYISNRIETFEYETNPLDTTDKILVNELYSDYSSWYLNSGYHKTNNKMYDTKSFVANLLKNIDSITYHIEKKRKYIIGLKIIF